MEYYFQNWSLHFSCKHVYKSRVQSSCPIVRLSPTTTVGIQTLGKEHRYLHYHIHGTLIMRMAGVSTANPDGTKGKDNAD